MKTERFIWVETTEDIYVGPAGDQSGEYVKAEVAEKLVEALKKISSGMTYDLLGTISMDRVEMQDIALAALKEADECNGG